MKKKCSVYVRNSDLRPSNYYRVVQYIEKLNEIAEFQVHNALNNRDFQKNMDLPDGIIKKGYQLFCYLKILKNRYWSICKDLKYKPDILIVQREIFPKYMPAFFKKKVIRLFQDSTVIWDFDDDIFWNHEISKREQELLCIYSRDIIGIGQYAKNLLPSKYHKKFIMMPTTDFLFCREEILKLQEIRSSIYKKEVRIVWVGTASNIKFLDVAITALEQAAINMKKLNKKLVLCVVCNIPYKKNVKVLHIENIKWSREIAKFEMSKAHIGIMPLANIHYVKGKGGFKLIQYLSAGIPVVASELGFCKEVINKDCGYLVPIDKPEIWMETIQKLGTDKKLWKKISDGAYKRYIDKFNIENNLQVWKELLRKKL